MLIQNFLYIILALFGIGFLIFIHELGHYFMARRVGITVEVFAIGFGRPIYEWEHKGVKWKIGWLPFGGYVKMAGTEKKGSLEPHQIPGGFFSKKPWDRIKVAAIGPLINILFAFLAFSLLWSLGGRKKPFSEFTHFIGGVDRDSTLYTEAHVRSGDQINTLNGKPFKGLSDLLYASVLEKNNPKIQGLLIDYDTGVANPFEYTFTNEKHLKGMERARSALSNLEAASYLIYNRMPSGKENPFAEGSPMVGSGLAYKDRIIWVDGKLVFSKNQLIGVLNEPKALLTVRRGNETFLTRIPRLKVADLKLSSYELGELDDWQYASGFGKKISDLYFIPYNLNADAYVENPVSYIDERARVQEEFKAAPRSDSEIPLQTGDQIVAVDGIPISSAAELFKNIQQRHVQIIVEQLQTVPIYSWREADAHFAQSFDLADLKKITATIGEDQPLKEVGSLRLLNPITPVPLNELPFSEAREQQVEAQRKAIEQIADAKVREAARTEFELSQKRLMLGIGLQDQQVYYNPTPFALFGDVFKETYKTLISLVTGQLSPKMISGPVGIVQVIHYGWMVGVKEALYWLAVISLNLGILNLLPIPVLDGGYITFGLIEIITKKQIKYKTMERLIIPFVVAMVLLFIYLTYNDVSRLIGQFF